jgi:hypothetical protein
LHKVTNFWATGDRTRLLEQSDALIFHAGQFNLSDLMPSRRLDNLMVGNFVD